MKKKQLLIILAIVFTCLMAIVSAYYFYFPYSRISFRVMVNNEVIIKCNDGFITKLSPKNGGYRFHDGKRASVYIIYGTGRGHPGDGTIVNIDVHNYQDKWNKSFSLAEENKAGAQPLLTTWFGDIKKETYHLTLAKPGGKLVLEIGRRRK